MLLWFDGFGFFKQARNIVHNAMFIITEVSVVELDKSDGDDDDEIWVVC